MSDRQIIEQCSPTLAGIKTGSLFTCEFENREEIFARIRNLNRTLGSKGVVVLPLRFKEGRALIYVFRPALLKKDLNSEGSRDIMESLGYTTENTNLCLASLRKKLDEADEFPHEVGLFLGYPPEDVKGFMEKAECKFCGLWKVYGDTEAAKNLFENYKRCTSCYESAYRHGETLEHLTVAV